MTQGYVIEVALLMLISLFMLVSWFSWLSSKHVRRPYPSNCSIIDPLMAWVGHLSCFHVCHDLGFHLASPGKQTRPPLFCSICYFNSATNDYNEKVLNHDFV